MDRIETAKNLKKISKKISDYLIQNISMNPDDINFLKDVIMDLNNLAYDYENEDLQYYIDNISEIIVQQDKEIALNEERDKPVKLNLKIYVSRMITKLNYLFRQTKILSKEEAINLYNDFDYLNKKYNTFLKLIDYINGHNIDLIPDRILFSAYLRINVDQYQYFLTSSPNSDVRNIFNSIEEFIITTKMNASELGTRNNQAIKTNLSYDKVGNSIKPNDVPQITNNTLSLTYEDVLKKMIGNGYNPEDPIEVESKEKTPKKIITMDNFK